MHLMSSDAGVVSTLQLKAMLMQEVAEEAAEARMVQEEEPVPGFHRLLTRLATTSKASTRTAGTGFRDYFVAFCPK